MTKIRLHSTHERDCLRADLSMRSVRKGRVDAEGVRSYRCDDFDHDHDDDDDDDELDHDDDDDDERRKRSKARNDRPAKN